MSGNTKTVRPFVERRPKPRRRVLLGGLVCFDEGRQSFGCTIRDLSESGARITVPKNRAVPSDIYLIITRYRVAHEAKLVWHNDVEAGFAFLNSILLADLTDPSLAYLTKLWLGGFVT